MVGNIHKTSEFVLRKIQGLYLLVPTGSRLKGNVLLLNDVAVFIWNSLDDFNDFDGLLNRLREVYGDVSGLESDLASLLKDLEEIDCIQVS
jgi:hypothetical protein